MSKEAVTLLTADWVIADLPDGRCLIKNGEVVFRNGEILFVGPDYPGAVTDRRDFGRALIAPGFIDLNALSDLDTTILSFDNQPEWAKGRVWPKSYMERPPYEMYSLDELVFQKRHAFARLIRNGITTAAPIASLFYRAWGETVAEFEGAAAAAEALGLRVYLGPAYRTGNPYLIGPGKTELHFDEPRGLAGLDEAIGFCERMENRGSGLVRTMLAPDRIETCTADLLRRTSAAGRDLGVPVRLHCCQSVFERDTVRSLHGATSIEWLDSLGFLSPNVLLPHGTHVAPSRYENTGGRDLDIVQERGAVIVHCPLVAARFGAGLESFRTYRDRGLRMALGTDTAPPDMLMNLQIGLLLCRFVEGDAAACSAVDYFDAATLGGADALGRTDLGRVAPGARADLVVWDLANPDLGQVIDPMQTLLIAGSGRDAQTVFIDGRCVMENRTLPDVAFEAETIQAQAQFNGLVAKYPDRSWNNPPVETLFPPSYPLYEGK